MVSDVQGEEVARLRAKDAQAFRSLIERLQQPITGYLYRLVGDREVALDLAQDTFLQAYKEISKTSPDLPVDAWVYRIATNYGLQYLNRRRLRQFISFSRSSVSSIDETIGGKDAEGNNLQMLCAREPSVEEQTETRVLVEQAMAQLKPQDAICLQLHFGVGFTYEQIGRIVKATPEAVRKRVARGVEKFRQVYGQATRTNTDQVYALKRMARGSKR
jgi:RNA polymerase sigma-70 factor (ECF subfamily)